jgi:hypothetical protein
MDSAYRVLQGHIKHQVGLHVSAPILILHGSQLTTHANVHSPKYNLQVGFVQHVPQ